VVNVISSQGDVARSGIDIWAITPSQLALMGLSPEQAALDTPDGLIALFERTFRYVGPDEYWSIRAGQERWAREPGEPTREDFERKDQIWHVRWSVPVKLMELLVARRAAGENISRHLSWVHRQLTRSWFPLPIPDTYRPHGILERIADWGIQRLLGPFPAPPLRHLDSEVLGEFLFAMDHFEVYDERTWSVLVRMGGHLRNEGFIHRAILLGKVYRAYHPPGLERVLRGWAAGSDHTDFERSNALTKVARVILEDKPLKKVEGPLGQGVALA
jgi:hypothetical protein